ncbi:MAG TPA: transglycosylase SLT domain-containing protein [Blastocatellia bacterium]|nr:transglycosylase SLT domain-containing protein [Blastocatellia bacterium]HMX26302.1 transglycosylase SLT domain-containing protein [Blastocatellia bacterium]HMY73509.1 transglycosylase SLT domain-containing protein [Blastocatellia bacterium]HNG31752.1 transglycosylase SLT domain-containing protein [Blastocatellia bacterium]
MIERSSGYFHSGEANFKDGNFDKARRDYDRAIDIVLESGIDVRSDARLQQHYQALVDNIFRRQMTLLSAAPAASSVVATVEDLQQSPTQNPSSKETSAGKKSEKQTEDRGFGQQTFAPSPLDELAKIKLTEDETKGVSEAQVETAVAAAQLDFNFRPNSLIQSFINYYQGRGRATMENGLRRSGRFMTLARNIFKEEGVPQDIAWLGQVESAWSPVARSWAAAVGLWQFIPGTGARYGLNQNYYVDERSSFEKATRASARYLKWLANRYDGNWELAMAAYNSGEGRVDAAVARSGYADFWEIYSRGLIPQETRNYVPNILATIIIAKNPEKYGFSVKPEPPLTYDFVKVNNMTDLRLVADATDTPYDYLTALNPELKRGVTPPGVEHLLRVPTGKGRVLQAALIRIPVEKRASWRMLTAQANDDFDAISRKTGVSAAAIEQVNGGVIKPGQKVIIPAGSNVRNVVFTAKGATASSPAAATTTSGAAKIITYKVRSGESLGDIAGRYNTSVRDLATLNRLSSSTRLRAGQVIKVPVRSSR